MTTHEPIGSALLPQLLDRRENLRAVIMMYANELNRVELAIRDAEGRLDAEEEAAMVAYAVELAIREAPPHIQREIERWAHPLPGDLTDDQLEFEQECVEARYTMLDAENDRDMGEIAIESEQENTE